jgi:hypothetical protein
LGLFRDIPGADHEARQNAKKEKNLRLTENPFQQTLKVQCRKTNEQAK